MDPNEAYRQLCEAIDNLRGWMPGGVPDGAEYDAQKVIDHWEALDGWMRKSGFPPVAWNNPVTVATKGMVSTAPLGEVVGGRYTPIRRAVEQQRAATRERDLATFMASRPALCRLPVGIGTCGLDAGHRGMCEE
jgi:hypothetical protein